MMHRQRRAAALAIVCFSAALCLQGILAPPKEFQYERQQHILQRRYLTGSGVDESHIMTEYGSSASKSPIGTRELSPFLASLSSYTLEDAIAEADPFRHTFAVMVYDPASDKFLGYYSKSHPMRNSYYRLSFSMGILSYMLRTTFPERFTPRSEEFALAISSGDFAMVDVNKLPHAGVAPVLHFGSVFRDEDLYSNLIAMPMLGLRDSYLQCFGEWAGTGRVCNWLQPLRNGGSELPKSTGEGALAFGEELGLEWATLKPQVVWRGSDFPDYLNWFVKPMSAPDIGSLQQINKQEDNKQQATAEYLRQNYNGLLPRWKGIVLTAEAELAAQEGKLPWANIKFVNRKGFGDSDKHLQFEDIGVSVVGKERMSVEDHALYKYQLDIAGGGGTTWTGTHTKLAMPGLLFHHITPTKDFFHDRIKPYVHYVPVAADLSDLKQKYEWAESNPEQAKMISDQATEWMRHLGTPEGFGQLFQEDFVQPLRRMIEAYQPISTTHPGKTWMDVLEPQDGSNMVRVLECDGLSYGYGSCKGDRNNNDEMVQEWIKSKGTYKDHFV